jgi:hypothetical protein
VLRAEMNAALRVAVADDFHRGGETETVT